MANTTTAAMVTKPRIIEKDPPPAFGTIRRVHHSSPTACWRSPPLAVGTLRPTAPAEEFVDLLYLNIRGLPCRAIPNLRQSRSYLFANSDAKRNADQVGILELDAGAFFPIIQEDIESFLPGLSVDILGDGLLRRIGDMDRNNDHLKGGNGGREHQAVFIMALLGGGGENPLHPDAVGAHPKRHLIPALVENPRPHAFRIPFSKLENVPDFDRAIHTEGGAAHRTELPALYHAQVVILGGEVPSRRHVPEVKLIFVRPANQVLAPFQGAIRQNADSPDPDGAQRSNGGSQQGPNFLGMRGTERFSGKPVRDLALAQRMVPAQENQSGSLAGLIHQSLQQSGRR